MLETHGLTVASDGGRVLIKDLRLSLGRERAALIGRNGMGKSTLMAVLAGRAEPDAGTVVRSGTACLVEQWPGHRVADALSRLRRELERVDAGRELEEAGLPSWHRLEGSSGLSPGELRKVLLLTAKLERPDILLLDEPTQDLDQRGCAWLAGWTARWPGALLVSSHDPDFLQGFSDFLLLGESGGRGFRGSFAELNAELEREEAAGRARYARTVNRLIEYEEHMVHIARRRARKRQYGRVSELGRATPRARLNQKRDYAQVKHGRMKKIREERIAAAREVTKAVRRTLKVELGMGLGAPTLPPDDGRALARLESVSATTRQKRMFRGLTLQVGRTRVGVVGPNGAGKTTLLSLIAGRSAPDEGSVSVRRDRVGYIAQGATNWMMEESLVSELAAAGRSGGEIAGLSAEHGFPLALAQRPLSSLSPGERVRAALILLFTRMPAPELLVLDEPSYCLDWAGRRGLIAALNAWTGGLVVASHDRRLLDVLRLEETVTLGD